MKQRPVFYGLLGLLGALVAFLISPPFSLAYFRAYGYSMGEVAPAWLASFGSAFPGLFSFNGRSDVYQTYGRIYILLIPLTLPGLLTVKQRIASPTWGLRWGYRSFLTGLMLMSLGIAGDYCCNPDGFWVGLGFLLELLGTLLLWTGSFLYGAAMLRNKQAARWMGASFLAIAPLGIAGLFVLAHIPSGPLVGYFATWLMAGPHMILTRRRER